MRSPRLMLPLVIEVVAIELFDKGDSTAMDVKKAPKTPSSSLLVAFAESRFLNESSKEDAVATSAPNQPLPLRFALLKRRSLSSSTIPSAFSFTLSPGTAKPIPALLPLVVMIMVLTPTTSPFKFNKGPPEFPGLMAASVCIQFLISFPATPVMERPNADTTPEERVLSNPNGLPMATRDCPTRRFEDDPYGSAFNEGRGLLSFSTATSNSLTTSTISHR
mmetsp:Transcript_19872/g.34207  ORF Transcript_19872/g.34207 Transcript_19872/m.34207 type:complete len:220 (-) Transcript_19872:1079-1738(-)